MARCTCTACSQPIEFPSRMAGQSVECPSCGETTTLSVTDEPGEIRVPTGSSRYRATSGSGALDEVTAVARAVIQNAEKVVIGKRQEIQLMLTALFSEGHVLLEDVPGVAKTMLARAIAQSIGGTFKRVQCTPDLLPNDITGASIFNPKNVEFEFRAGPIFANVVVVDEINRATPRTQSALLEAMAERGVTVDGTHHTLVRPFMVIATQNPIDHEGTFPLPEAQLDRFLLRLSLGYPSFGEEGTMLDRMKSGHPIDTLEAVVPADQVARAQAAVREVYVDNRVRDYILKIVHSSRQHGEVRLGGSPRASQALYRAGQAFAAIQGDDAVLPDYVKLIAPAVLGHRIILKPEARIRKITTARVIEEILRDVDVPLLPER